MINRRTFIEILCNIGLFGNLYKLGNKVFMEKSDECYMTYENGFFNICTEKDGILFKNGYTHQKIETTWWSDCKKPATKVSNFDRGGKFRSVYVYLYLNVI